MLNVTNLHVSYGQSEALHGINFSAHKNETVAIMGRNGMGKTTTVKSIVGLLPAAAGTVRFRGERIDGLNADRIGRAGMDWYPKGGRYSPT